MRTLLFIFSFTVFLFLLSLIGNIHSFATPAKLGEVCGFYDDICDIGLYCINAVCTNKSPECFSTYKGNEKVCQKGSTCDKYHKICIDIEKLEKSCNSTADCLPHQYCNFETGSSSYKKCIPKKDQCDYSQQCKLNYYCDLPANTCKRIYSDYNFCLYYEDCSNFETCSYFGSTPVGLCYPWEGRCTKKFENETCKPFEECNDDTNRCKLRLNQCEHDYDCKQSEYCNTSNNFCELITKKTEKQADNQNSNSISTADNASPPLTSLAKKSVVFIFDTSGSMADDNKLELAKNASISALAQIENAEIALLKFDGCHKIKMAVNWTTDQEAIKNNISAFGATGSTPITKSLNESYKLINERAGLTTKAYVVIFTDGEETCGGNPCEVVKEQSKTSKIPIYTIGYMVGPKAREQLQCIANYSGGRYLEAPTPVDIENALKEMMEIIEGNKTCTVNEDCHADEVCIGGECTLAKLHLVFVPVNWKSGDDKFGAEVKAQTDFFLYSIPSLDNCKEKVKISKADDCNFTINRSGSISDLSEIYKCALKKYEKFDFAIGIGEKGIFDDGIAGYTAKNEPIFIELGNDMVTAHEMGHKFGLVDEYCYCPSSTIGCGGEPNPLKAEYGCDPNGGCCWEKGAGQICMVPGSGRPCITGYEDKGCYTCCDGNKNELGGISIMGWANAVGPRYHDAPSLKYLANDYRLRCD